MNTQNLRFLRAIFLSIAISVLIHNASIINYWISPSGLRFISSRTIILLEILCLAVVVPILIIVIAFSHNRDLKKNVERTLALLAIYVIVAILYAPFSRNIAQNVRLEGFKQFSESSTEVINAIERFENNTGHLPSKLLDLNPIYLTSVPRERIGTFVDYYILTGNDSEERYGYDWVLVMDVQVNYFDNAYFIYRPEQDYGSEFVQMGKWGFVGVY